MKKFLIIIIFILLSDKLMATDTYDRIIQKAVVKYQPEYYPELVLWHKARIQAESRFDPNAESYIGALGLCQFMPETAEELNIDPLNPNQCIPAMVYYTNYIAEYIEIEKLYPLNYLTAQLFIDAAYNYGMGRIRRLARAHHYNWDIIYLQLPFETKTYVNRIQRYKRNYEREL
jgi:soluble lytic murein transglycosylase-like protein